MAEAVLFNLATDILKLAGSKTFSEIQLVRGLRDELNSLKGTMETVRAVLLDAEKQQWHNHQVNHWLKRLKNVLYDVQDLLDDVATEDLRRKVTPGNKMSKEVRIFFSKSNQLAHRRKVAKKIQKLRLTLDRIAKDKNFHLEPHLSEATVTCARGRTTDSFVRKEEIIGRRIDNKKIIGSLLDSSSKESVSVVSIVGMGGLGKTTLARLVYNDEKIRKCFKLKMWACVSDVFDEDSLIKEILKSAQDECQGDPELMRNLHDIENKSKDQLQSLLRKALDGKKYLLVLDDLWNENRERWLELQRLLMGGSRGSKILITTRNQSVVQATDKNSVVHDLHVLSEDESWDLLEKMALGDGKESSYQKLEETGIDIVKKCGGVPLAIKTIGNLLYARKEKEWLYFKERELSKIDELNPGIMDVLKLSYNHLPSGLKNCFAYCALFPKDYVFDKQTMIQLWMAQGFIESLDEDEKLEDIGDSYVSDLLSRSFLEVEEVGHYTGEVKMFKMHDLMHDLALKVAGNECKMVSHNKSGIGADTRHASFALQLSSLQEVTSLLEETTLRTFLSMKKTPSVQKLSSNEYHGIFSKFRRCRTLVLDNVDFCIPTSLGSRLKHLRFLDVSKNQSIKSLDSITDSLNLQTLKLYECKNLKTFPKDRRKLIKLRYLLIDGCNSLSRLPPLSELPSLRTLILVGLDALQFLHQTRDPKQFHITRPFFPSLQRLSLLNCRNLKGCWGNNSESPFPKVQSVEIRGCPDLHSVPPFPQVEYLSIEGTKILEQQLLDYLNCPSKAAVGSTLIPFSKLKRLDLSSIDLEPSRFETLFQLASNLKFMRLFDCDLRRFSRGMQHLSSLQELDITNCQGLDLSCQEDEYGIQWQFLTNLRVLNISNCLDLVTLTEGIQYMTTLQSLKICDCPSLKSLTKSIKNLSSLQMLTLSTCPRLRHYEKWKPSRLVILKIQDCPDLFGKRKKMLTSPL